MPEINCFISYSRENEEFAIEFTNDLQALGVATWRDKENIPAGASWDDEIEQAILRCTHFILIATPAAVASKHVRNELNLADEKDKIIVPIMYEACELPWRVARNQWVNFQEDYETGLAQFCAEIGIKYRTPEYRTPEVYKPYLNRLFADALDRMERLCGRNNEFTNQEFLKDMAREKSLIYIDFLYHVKDYLISTRGEEYAQKWVFNLVHQSIGGQLSRDARQAGYEQIKGKQDETDIWGGRTNRVTYRRPKQ